VLPVPFQNPWLQALYAALYSYGLAAWSVVLAMATTGWALGPANGGFNDLPTFLVFLKHTWFAGILGLVFSIGPYARARQGFTAAKGENSPPPEQSQPAPNPT
jgi:hypothetical protein